MDSLLPLIALWAFARSRGGPASSALQPPPWPTTSSPPPIPAFSPHAPLSADTGTPLVNLHTSPPTAAPAPAAPQPPPTPKGRATTPRAPGGRAVNVARRAGTPGLASKSVLALQRLINTRGGVVANDGVFGPKTAAAWRAIAKKFGLPPTIERANARTARVNPTTYEILNVPSIP